MQNAKWHIKHVHVIYRLEFENKWYKDHSLLIFNDESLFFLFIYLFIYFFFYFYYYYGDTHLSCIGNDNFGVLIKNVFEVLFVTQTYRSFPFIRHIFFIFPLHVKRLAWS